MFRNKTTHGFIKQSSVIDDTTRGIVTQTAVNIGPTRTVDIEVENTHSYQIRLPKSQYRLVSHNTLSLLVVCYTNPLAIENALKKSFQLRD